MRSFHHTVLTTVLLGTALFGCNDGPSPEHVIRAAEPIQGGTVDKTDTAVVGILINTSQGLALCSGSLIGPNLVLSAHHCVADPPSNTACSSSSFGTTYTPASFVVTTSYDAAATAFNSNSFPSADNVTWFAVNAVSVPGDNICGQDMSALQLSSPITGVCPIIPRVDADVTDGEAYTAVGFGITSPKGTTAGTRYTVAGLAVVCAEDCGDPSMSTTQEWEGGSTAAKGTCEGDSGGPALDSAGRVMGSVSRGPANACNSTVYESVYGEAAWNKQVAQTAAQAGGYAAAGWVTGASTSSAANGYCGSTGTTSSSSSASSSTSGSGGTSGGCPSPLSCVDGSGQGDYGCFDPSTTNGFPANAPTCSQTKACATGFTCWAASASASTGDCIEDCTPGSTSSTTSSGSGSSTTSSTGSGSGSSTASSTGSGSGSSTTSGTGSGTAASGNGGATAGSGNGGAGGSSSTGGRVNLQPGQSSSCSVSAGGSARPSSGWLAVAALGLVLRRRRNRR